MLESRSIYCITAIVVALCLSTASASERVTFNETVLDCVPEGCFVVRYVPVPRLKSLREVRENIESEVAEKSAQVDNEKPDEIGVLSINKLNAEAERSEPEKFVEREIAAQEKTARWTKVLGWVGIITVPLLVITLFANIRAIVETRKIGRIENRAYLGIEECVRLATSEEEGYTPSARLKIRNSGATPAYNVHVRGRMWFSPDETLIISPERWTVVGADDKIIIDGGGRRPCTFGDRSYSKSNFDALREGRTKIHFVGEIRFKDIFGDDRATPFYIVFPNNDDQLMRTPQTDYK